MTTRTDRIQVIFEVGGDGKLKATLGDIGKQGATAAQGMDRASASQARLTAAAKAAGVVLGGALVTGLSLVIKNTMEAERVDAQLEARLKSTAGAAGMTKQALDDLATATARKTTYDDEAVKAAEAMLLTFTKIHADVFPKAIDAITDMATAMGTDLESAAVSVGKALQDPEQGLTNLSRMGVQFSDSQKEVIKSLVETGQTAAAQGVILQELQTQFGGAAAAARDTFGGALAALKNTLMDLTEGGGGSLNSAKTAVEDLNKAMSDPGTKKSADDLTAALFKLAEWGVTAGRAFVGFGQGMASMLAEMRNQGSATLEIWQQIATLGMADGTISGAMDQAAAGRKNLKRTLDDMVLQNHGMTRESYNKQFAAQWDVGVPGIAKPSTFPQSGFNFAADMAARAPMPTSPAKPAKTGAGGGGGRSASPSAPRGMPDFYRDTVEDIQREIEAAARLDGEWNKLAATLSGPLAAAEYEHQQNLLEIETLGTKAGASAQAIADAKAQETAAYEKQRAEIEASLDPMGQLLQAYEMEASLIGLGNAERAMANALRREGIDLASEEAQAYMASARAVDDTARAHADAMGYVGDLKGVTKNLLMDMSKDAAGTFKNIGDYWEDLVDQILSRWYDAGLDGLFSGKGFSGFAGGFGGGGGGGGSSGGGFWSMLGGLFGGGGNSGFAASANGVSGADFASIFGEGAFGLAQGGPANKGQLYEVAEYNKPEVFRANGRTWLIPGSNGVVQPMGDGSTGGMSGGGDSFHMPVVINVRGDDRARTADQVADRLDRRTSRAKRNR